MTFFDDLYAKVNELRTAFKERYAGDFGFMVTEDGGLALKERSAPEFDARKVAECQAFFFEVEMLCGRLMQYDDLDPAPYHNMIVALGVDHDAGQGAPSWTTFGFLEQTIDVNHMAGVLGLVDGGEWQGETAQAFEDGFLKQFFVVLVEQRKALYELALLIEAYHQATKRVQQDLKNIIDNGINVLQGRQIQLDTFGVISILATAVGVFAFPALTLPAAVGAVSLATGFASILGSAEDPVQRGDYTIEGDDAPAIRDSIANALRDMENVMEANDRNIATVLEQGLNSVSSFKNPQLDLVPPAMAVTPDFGRMWLSYDPTVPIEHDQVVITLVDLYEAGQRHVPHTATLYDAVRIGIDYISIPKTPYHRHWWYSSDHAAAVVDRLVEIFRNSRDTMTAVAEALIEIADDYDLTDCESAEFVKQVGARLAPDAGIAVGFPT